MMVPGYMFVLLLLIVSILWMTGWRTVLVPSVQSRWLAAFIPVLALLLFFPLWLTPFSGEPDLVIHACAILIFVIAFVVMLRTTEQGQRGYLVLCAFMLAIVWGSAKSLYSHESIFYWIDPAWDIPVLGGLLCGAFASDSRHQLFLVCWGAMLGDLVDAMLKMGQIGGKIGSWAWWDSFAIALCSASSFALAIRFIRVLALKLSTLWMYVKGGRPS